MTSDSNPPGTPGTPDESPIGSAAADAKAAFQNAGFSTPEGMVGFGALILVANWLIFTFLLERASTLGFLELLLAAAVIALFFGKATFLTRIASKPVLMKTFGYGLVVLGALTLLFFLRSIDHSRTAVSWISNLITLVGYAVVYMGARAIKVD